MISTALRYRQSNIQTALNSLKTDQGGASLLQIAEQSIALRKLLSAWPALRGVNFQAGPVKQGVLVLYVANPSALARIKHSVPSLIEMLQGRGWVIHQIKVKIQSLGSAQTNTKPTTKRAVFSNNARKEWQKLEESLEDPDIKAATSRLNRRHNSAG